MNFLIYLLVIVLFRGSFAYIITVDSHAEECFFDSVHSGSKMGKREAPKLPNFFNIFVQLSGLMFETIEGGFLDIDVRIVGPDGKVIYQVPSC